MILRKYAERSNITLWMYLKIRCYIYFLLFYPITKVREILRKNNHDKSFDYIKKIHNRHYGKRCFIIGTGPSLRTEDINKLKTEYTFGVNAVCLLFAELKWKTTYFVISDDKAYKRLNSELPKEDTKNIFISSRKRETINADYTLIPKNVRNSFLTTNKYKKFSNDIHANCFDATTVVFNTMQIAVYMGFKEICLLGVDCTYDNTNKQYSVDHGIRNPYYKSAGRQMIEDFKVAKRFTDQFGIKVYNATRGGMLEVFERVDLDEYLNDKR
jgi:hypothetical protein